MTTFDDILEEAGKFGRSQKRIFGLLCLVSMPFAGVYVGIVFQGFTPEHWCRDPGMSQVSERCGWTPLEARQFSVPRVTVSAGAGHSQCEMYDKDWNNTVFICDDTEDGFSNFSDGFPIANCKYGWEYDYGGRKSFVTEFDLVCANDWLVDMFQAAVNAGFLFGSIIVGYLADRFGRKMSFLMSNILNGIIGILMAISPNYVALLVFRFLHGLSVKGGWIAGYVLITELVGVEYRRTVGIIYQMFFSIGLLILPLIAYLITDWRWLQVALSAPYLIFFAYYWFIPESPRWLLTQKNSRQAVKITKKIANENRRILSNNVETLKDDNVEAATASFVDLIRTPKMRKHTFILMFNWFTSAVVYQGLIMRLGIQGGNVYVDFLITAVAEFPAALLILFTIDRVGRRLPFATANVVSGLACFIVALSPEGMFWFKTAVACVGRLGITMTFELVAFVNTELYPTFIRSGMCVMVHGQALLHADLCPAGPLGCIPESPICRNLGVSVCSALSDFGGIVAPFLLYRLSGVWLELPLVIFGVLSFIAGILVLMLPETRGVPLPQTIDDIESPDRHKKSASTEPQAMDLLDPEGAASNGPFAV